MKVRDKITYNNYDAFVVKRKVTIELELGQGIDLFAGDFVVQTADLSGYLLVDAYDFGERFEILYDER